ncbi:SIMPL domain-containing protein [Sphingomonas sp. J344]|uniref:SIMPL domain-containing protein n=2 Tax=unclassified Sphingomonas TaxID=196159 RepID=UPI0021507734|nr:SIMPL domain-containing protein [Sphingomonas sp. J344]MCR5870639.1 SIMPL domain-containing protein [Sphingomonas sp. J344]
MIRLMTVAALAATFPLAAAAQVAPSATAVEGTLLDVVAEGRVNRVPDVALIRAGVVSQGATAAEALTANARQMASVLTALKAAGIADRDVQTATISLNPQYRYAENQPPAITGYQATNSVSVRFRDIARSGTILDALVKQGANQIDGPNLTIDAIDAAMDEARVDAVKRARARAELYARTLGMRVARIVVVSEGSDGDVPGPMPQMMVRAEAKDSTQIAPGEQQVSANVRVRFLLQ